MTYIPDGAKRDYKEGPGDQYYAWGWLSSDHSFPQGWESEDLKREFLEAVKELEIVDKYRGWHTDRELNLDNRTEPYPNGSRKFEHEGTVFTAPTAVTYYIEELDYRPPDEVVDALLA